jgi:hypothetical protein
MVKEMHATAEPVHIWACPADTSSQICRMCMLADNVLRKIFDILNKSLCNVLSKMHLENRYNLTSSLLHTTSSKFLKIMYF